MLGAQGKQSLKFKCVDLGPKHLKLTDLLSQYIKQNSHNSVPCLMIMINLKSFSQLKAYKVVS